MKRKFKFRAVVTPGFESVASDELSALGLVVTASSRGGLSFEGPLVDAFRVLLWSRTVGRVLVRLASFKARSFPDLFKRAGRVDWARYLSPGASLQVVATARRSRLIHTGRIIDTLSSAIKASVSVSVSSSASSSSPKAQRLVVRLEDDECTLSLDMSGEHMHRRGYRQAVGRAPLRETMAASLLAWSGWRGQAPLLDPMCGSGTFPVEAAWVAAGRAPGLMRRFAFESWPKFDAYAWRRMRTEAQESLTEPASRPLIMGADRDAEVIEHAKANARRAQTPDVVWRVDDVAGWSPQEAFEGSPGWWVCNPPYGARIGSVEALTPVYAAMGASLAGLRGWRAVVIIPQKVLRKTFEGALGRTPEDRCDFEHGGLSVSAWRYTV